MNYFLKNYLPYGCIGAVLAILVNSASAIINDASTNPAEIIALIGIATLLTIASYLLSLIDFTSTKVFYLCEYFVFLVIVVVVNYLTASTNDMTRMIFEMIIWTTIIYIFIRCYLSLVFTRDVKRMNMDIENLHK